MPLKEIKYTNEMDDGRRKLSAQDHEAVRRHYALTKSQRQTAAHFGVSRRLVCFILYPDRLARHKAQMQKRKAHRTYYDTERHRLYMRRYRAKKRSRGLLTWETASPQACYVIAYPTMPQRSIAVPLFCTLCGRYSASPHTAQVPGLVRCTVCPDCMPPDTHQSSHA